MELTQQQHTVLDKIKAFLNGDSAVFILRGYAGTGKTTMIKAIVDSLEPATNIVLMAPTGRAANVLSKKIGREGKEASTIHGAIYVEPRVTAKEVKDIADSEFKYFFPINRNHNGELVCIIDEASMLSSQKLQGWRHLPTGRSMWFYCPHCANKAAIGRRTHLALCL